MVLKLVESAVKILFFSFILLVFMVEFARDFADNALILTELFREPVVLPVLF